MRFDYSPELEDYRAEVRAFIARHGPGPRKRVGVRAPEPGQVPALRAWVARLYAAGYLGQTWPVEYGGRPGATIEHTFIVAEEIARARTWGEIGAGALAAGAILSFGSEQQRQRYLPRIRSGEDLWCQLFSEPGAGSDLASLKTRAVRDADHYVVNGQKVWTTNGHHADLGYLLARTNPDVAKQAGITAFALDMRTPGVDVRPLRSWPRLALAIRQPLSTSPITWSAGMRTLSRKTSLKSLVPVISRSGRTSTPGVRMSRANAVMPACLATSGLVRASR